MKLLHTGDLHLGKTLHDASLAEDQAAMLDLLARELGADDYSALVIAGDVYDRAVPPAEAVALFSGFLARVRKERPDVDIFIVPGNHDSAQRLSFADAILGEQRIHIVGDPERSFTPIILSKGDDRLAFFLLPFLSAGTLAPPDDAAARPSVRALARTDARSAGQAGAQSGAVAPEFDFDREPDGPEPSIRILATQADLASEAARRLDAVLSSPDLAGVPSVLVAHLFAAGGAESSSERIFVGSAERVPPALFARFSYVALGHLHRPQRVTDRVWYSGSPLAYAFDEAADRKRFLKVDIDCRSKGFPVSVTDVPVTPFRAVTRLSGSFADFHSGSAHDARAADWLEITLTDSSLVANPIGLLRAKFPYLLSVRQGALGASSASDPTVAGEANGQTRDPVSDFCRFEEMLYGSVDPAKRELFASLLKECADEA